MSGLNLLLNRLNRNRISDHLLTTSYDQDRKLYYNDRDNTAGFLLEIEPVNFVSKQTQDGLTAFLSAKWPKDTIVQIGLYSDPNLDTIIDAYRHLRGPLDDVIEDEFRVFLHDWANENATYLNDKRFTGIDVNEVPVPFRNFRSFITVKIPCSISDFYSRSTDVQLLLEHRESLLGVLRTSHIFGVNMQPDEYIRFMYQLFNPGHPYPIPLRAGEELKTKYRERVGADKKFAEQNRPFIGWDPSVPLYDQVVASDNYARLFRSHLKLDGNFVLTKTPAKFPERISPIDINLLIGDVGRANRRQITTPFLFTLLLDLNSQEKAISQKANLVLYQKNALPALRSKIEKRHSEFQEASARMENGDKFIHGMMTMTLFAKTQNQLDSAGAAVDALWQNQGYRLQNESGLNFPLFLNSVPFGATKDALTKLKRTKPAPVSTFSMLAPLQADHRGAGGKPVHLLISRRGQLFTMDLMDSDTNYNALVVAPSGSGKSFFINGLITSTLSIGGRSFIIDIGRSYEKLCRTLGGQFVEFTSDSDICLNVFSLITYDLWHATDQERSNQRDELRTTCEALLAQMANPMSPITETEKSLLSRLLGQCYDELKSADDFFSIDTLIAKLMEQQKRNNVENQNDNLPGHLAERLHRYGSKGKHGAWFKGKYNIEFDKPLVVLELEELNANEDLKQVVLMLIMASIEHKLYIQPDRSKPTMVIMDEAWSMLTGANTAKFLEEGFRRARKYNGSFVVITQSIFDLRDKNQDIYNAIVPNCAWRYFLQPKEEEVRRAIAESVLSLGEYELNLMLSTHTSRGQYSEIFFIDPRGMVGIGRFHVNKFTELLFTTNPKEIDLINALRKQGLPPAEAIRKAVPLLECLHKGMSLNELLEISSIKSSQGVA